MTAHRYVHDILQLHVATMQRLPETFFNMTMLSLTSRQRCHNTSSPHRYYPLPWPAVSPCRFVSLSISGIIWDHESGVPHEFERVRGKVISNMKRQKCSRHHTALVCLSSCLPGSYCIVHSR
ncbi:hypothetical protein TNCV_4831881 [Trichonephila clavipes]|nr:hypothetical protein TNCV_4831881 [Trichonephila clavipes]